MTDKEDEEEKNADRWVRGEALVKGEVEVEEEKEDNEDNGEVEDDDNDNDDDDKRGEDSSCRLGFVLVSLVTEKGGCGAEAK